MRIEELNWLSETKTNKQLTILTLFTSCFPPFRLLHHHHYTTHVVKLGLFTFFEPKVNSEQGIQEIVLSHVFVAMGTHFFRMFIFEYWHIALEKTNGQNYFGKKRREYRKYDQFFTGPLVRSSSKTRISHQQLLRFVLGHSRGQPPYIALLLSRELK